MFLQIALIQDTAVTSLLDYLSTDTASFMQMTKMIRRELLDGFGRDGYDGIFILHSFASINMVSLVSGVAVNGLAKKREYFNGKFGWGHGRLEVLKSHRQIAILFKPGGYLRILDIEVPYLALDFGPEIKTLPLFILISHGSVARHFI